jgi:hypothetical protein
MGNTPTLDEKVNGLRLTARKLDHALKVAERKHMALEEQLRAAGTPNQARRLAEALADLEYVMRQ